MIRWERRIGTYSDRATGIVKRKEGAYGMAFGIGREELQRWKAAVARGEIAFLTHYWYEPRFPQFRTVTKVGCADLARLAAWCERHDLDPKYIHRRQPFPHFDLIGSRQRAILELEGQRHQIDRFGI